MSELYTEEQTVTLVTHLTRTRLIAFVEAEVVIPVQSEAGPSFRRSDIARLELLSELAEFYGMEAEAAAVTMTVLDQLHAARSDLQALLGAIEREPPEVVERITASLIEARADTDK